MYLIGAIHQQPLTTHINLEFQYGIYRCHLYVKCLLWDLQFQTVHSVSIRVVNAVMEVLTVDTSTAHGEIPPDTDRLWP